LKRNKGRGRDERELEFEFQQLPTNKITPLNV